MMVIFTCLIVVVASIQVELVHRVMPTTTKNQKQDRKGEGPVPNDGLEKHKNLVGVLNDGSEDTRNFTC